MFINEVIRHLEDTLGEEHNYTTTLKTYVAQMEDMAPVKHINALALEFIDWRLETIRSNMISGHGSAWAATMDEETVRQTLIESLDTKDSFMQLAAQITRQNKGVLLTTRQVELLQNQVWKQCNAGSSCVNERISNMLNSIKNNLSSK